MAVLRVLFCLLIVFTSYSSCGNNTATLKSTGYSVCYTNNPLSEKWGNYLFKNLRSRMSKKDILLCNENKKNYKTIIVDVDTSLNYDYQITHIDKTIKLQAKNEQAIVWLAYQFMKLLADCDDRFTANDIPPAIINCKTHHGNFDFNYREPFFAPNMQYDYSLVIGTNVVERDWGIWGHNLHKALHNRNNDSLYARDGEWIDAEQYCFSSNEIFNQIETYITDNYGRNGSKWFMIMPNDNTTVCMCKACVHNGNTPVNATPAVSALINRLAKHFPQHMFFTTAYLSTKQAPAEKWADNTGVMISTIDLPKGIKLNPKKKQVNDFLTQLDEWKKCTPNIYIWDYAANFDDYLTPLPILYGLQNQFKFFKQQGIKGIFLNASGYDYSPFDDVKTYITAALMMNTNLPVDSLCTAYFTQNYPTAGKVLSNYYLELEKDFDKKQKTYNMYGGFRETLTTYFDKNKFMNFYGQLERLIDKAEKPEKEKLKKLYTALSYARLQIAYTQIANRFGLANIKNDELNIKPEIGTYVQQLSDYALYENLVSYKEVGGSLRVYTDNWNELIKVDTLKNQLLNKPIKVVSKLDEDYTNIRLLNDGMPGFTEDYHQGWHISTIDNLNVQFDTKNIKSIKHLLLRFLIDEKHRIYMPEKVEIYCNGKLHKTIVPEKNTPHLATVNTTIDCANAQIINIIAYRIPNRKGSIACDEIRIH